MSKQEKVKTVIVNIDGEDYEIPAGTNIIEAAASVGKEIPHYCYHPKLTVAGNCRMCLVEMGMPMRDRKTREPILDDDGKQKIGWMPKPAIACGTNAAPGMHIKTNSAVVKDCQEGVMEMLLVNHPLDCPICDQAGECRLQEFATDYGQGYSRYVERKNVKPKRSVLGPRVTLDDERCILCSRCVRFCQEVVKDDVLGFVDHGSHSALTCYPGKRLENNYSLNTVDICPVGALTSTDFRFKMRVWFLKRVKSICTESSVGCNTEVFAREGKIYRITPRRNDAVNDTWMPDSGRELYKQVEAENRLTQFKVNGNRISAEEAYIRFSEILPTCKTAYVGSSHMSLEEQFLFAKIGELQPGPVYWLSHLAKGDGLLVSEDRTPNLRGAFLTGLVKEYPKDTLPSALIEKIESGEVSNIVVYHEDLTQVGLTAAQLKKLNLIYLGTHSNPTAEVAKLILPTLMAFEKSGTFVNQQFRLQKFDQVLPGPAGIMPDIFSMNRLMMHLSKEHEAQLAVSSVWEQIRKQVPQFAEIAYDSISDEGCLIDGSAFDSIDFPEGKSLHYEPKKGRGEALTGRK